MEPKDLKRVEGAKKRGFWISRFKEDMDMIPAFHSWDNWRWAKRFPFIVVHHYEKGFAIGFCFVDSDDDLSKFGDILLVSHGCFEKICKILCGPKKEKDQDTNILVTRTTKQAALQLAAKIVEIVEKDRARNNK